MTTRLPILLLTSIAAAGVLATSGLSAASGSYAQSGVVEPTAPSSPTPSSPSPSSPATSAPAPDERPISERLTPEQIRRALSTQGQATVGMTAPAREGLELVQRLGHTVDLSIPFKDHRGKVVTLGEFFKQDHRPVLMAMVYFRCPLQCKMITASLLKNIQELDWKVGEQYNVVIVTFDPNDGVEVTSAQRRDLLEAYGRAGAGFGSSVAPDALDGRWGVLSDHHGSARRLADELGFPYKYLPESGEFAHASVSFVLTPNGMISRYLPGVNYPTSTVRMALLEAADGRIGNLVEWFAHYCFVWDPTKGAYVLGAWRVMQVGAIASAMAVGGVLAWLLVVERRRRARRLADLQAA